MHLLSLHPYIVHYILLIYLYSFIHSFIPHLLIHSFIPHLLPISYESGPVLDTNVRKNKVGLTGI